ncbi:unnamed protein product, partial [Cuscuta epithymum]
MSHHKPREGAFKLNDVFTIKMHVVLATTLLFYDFFHKGIALGL